MNNRFLKSILTVLFILCITILIPSTISYARENKKFDISKQDIVISKTGDYVITGTTDKYTIKVTKGVSANITLNNVSITNPFDLRRSIDLIDIKSGSAVNLILIGTNILKNEYDYAAIHVPYGAKLIISPKSSGNLKAIGGYNAAAIGGSSSDTKAGCGTIQIKGGTIYAEGGLDSCAIGGGTTNRFDSNEYEDFYLGGGDITISGGNVTAVSVKGQGLSNGAAAIGGSSLTRQGKIAITGGVVTAISNEAGIGGEALHGKGNVISISGGTVISSGNIYGAGIGNSTNPVGTTVTISGGMVTAKGDYGDRTIYDAYVTDSERYRDSVKAEDIAAEKIVISGGHIEAYSFLVEPVNPQGIKVYPIMINCGKGPITSMKIQGDRIKSYGYKDMVSKGYLRMYMPNGVPDIEIKSNNTTLYKDYLYITTETALQKLKLIESLTADLSKGTLELIEGGCIYNNEVYRTNHIIATGYVTKHQILVHSNRNQLQNLTLKELQVDYTNSKAKDFLIIDNDVTLQLHLKGENSLKLPDDSRGFFVGNDARLCITGDEEKDVLTVTGGKNTNVIFTNMGDVIQYGGKLQFELGDNGTAINMGNYGTFTLCNGSFEAHTNNGYPSITSPMKMQLNIYGGSLITDSIGVLENGNEEAPNRAYFTMTGGSLEVADRMIFIDYRIYGGDMKARIFGCGIGCDVTLYGGDIEIGAFVSLDVDDIEVGATIFGGTVVQRNDVPKEELDKIIRTLS